jgi:hypothetical protein
VSLIDAATMADLTALDESAQEETVTITTVQRTSDGGGGYTETTVNAYTTGMLWSVSGDEAGEAQIRAQGRHRLAIPKTVTVSSTATITVRGKRYAVKYPFPVTYYSTSRILGLEDA